MNRNRSFGLACMVALLSSTMALADSVTYTASGNYGSEGLAASVTFSLNGTTLTISLTNTAPNVVQSNTTLLTGVFWNSSSSIGGTFSSIALGGVGTGPSGNGSVVDPTNGDTGYFAYGTNSGGPGGRNFGAFSAGYANWDTMILGPNGTAPPNSPDGPAGGLISTAGLTGSSVNKPVIEDTAVWTITGVNQQFILKNIEDVFFQYGTDLNEPGIPGNIVPLPAAASMGMGLFGAIGGIGLIRRRRLHD